MPNIRFSNIRSKCCQKKVKKVVVVIASGPPERGNVHSNKSNVCPQCVRHMVDCDTCELTQSDIIEQ